MKLIHVSRATWASLVVMAFAGQASASLIDFNSHGPDDFGTPIVDTGYNFDFVADGWGCLTDSYAPLVPIVQNGTTRLAFSGDRNGQRATVTFKPTDDSAFTLNKFDAATFITGVGGGIDVTGNLEGGGTVAASFVLTDSFATFVLPGTFANLDSVVIVNQFSGTSFNEPGVSLDNLVINEAVPEPATITVVGLALAGLAKRRKAARK